MIYDINLIPKAKKNVSSETIFITTTLSLCCIALLIYFGFYLPIQQKYSLSKQISEQENELLSYSDTQEQYSSILNQVNEFIRTDLTLGTLKSSNLKMTKILNEIEKNIPKNVIVKTMTLEEGLLTIEGNAPSYQNIAQCIVKLRNMENVLGVTFTNAMKEETMGEASIEKMNEENTVGEIPKESREGKDQLNNFTIYVNFNVMDVLTELLTEQSAAMTTAGEETIQNETY